MKEWGISTAVGKISHHLVLLIHWDDNSKYGYFQLNCSKEIR